MIEIRPERPDDEPAVFALTERAFGKREIAVLNDRLRSNGRAALSLVASNGSEILGHAMFSPAVLDPESPLVQGVSLGPLAVLPSFQGRGIARRLVETGLGEMRKCGLDFVMLRGSPELFPRFGFAPAGGFGLRCEADVPADEFMVVELRRGALQGVRATASFAPEFAEAETV